ncbi:bifunctional phosphoribosylaminoimidazolecarboxamide formyltransferase/IMP cyclohydrolase [Candidatus Contubernalis alkaliaceticus]|uniref:bifunctional phosphoribosylaminoimidazolecarboxamide formyltransferase/IMP cyclohydrolase n=1 Tax=Candidatus Contubernalis alkaliaceticus TaxID=338645 RepID=UPI001F4BFE5B|nr:bifunctional phosphoribosylaminoimidazolecarboxamide formyltransferase/IMP cyclohydrolase [Candidatus Contubernalis alkalaceticus]UNC91516.1 bifunctional phosphoribosylaminoimidazolecarboxamide formyltransferase/IMP cyclohydrolase [Candidatus Contubernalis alkalaceticus]
MSTKYALLSVSDKSGVVDFARSLTELGFEILSTGGTKKSLADAGVPVKSVSEVTGFPEILEGRLKTLHPKIHGGILGKRGEELHQKQMAEHDISPIDLVVVNLYPFAQTIAKEGVTLEDAIENIDIGGPTMVRSAAKNYKDVAVVVNPDRYQEIIDEIKEKGSLSQETRFQLAVEAFTHTAEYDALISSYLSGLLPGEAKFRNTLLLNYKKVQDLRYGENPQQQAVFYREVNPVPSSIAFAQQFQGKELSFNNINDTNAAWELVQEYQEPTIVAVKHANPCGVGTGAELYDAYIRAYDSDPVSIFGGIIAANTRVDKKTAEEILKIFIEVIIAPEYDPEALEALKAKKDIRVLQAKLSHEEREKSDFKKVSGGLLVQELDTVLLDPADWQVVTKRKPTDSELADLVFGMKVVKHVKSNAIVLAKNLQTIGVGAGQMNRVGAARIAIEQAGEKAKGSALASDAFFPFPDTVEEAAKAGVTALIQPGGSLKDKDAIETADSFGMTMLFTGRRYFKH